MGGGAISMKNAIILHGMPGKKEYYNPDIPSASNFHWYPWLQKQLLIHDIDAQTPEIPNVWKTGYETWRKEFERYDITPQTILVGHSYGGGFIVRWLSENPNIKVGKVVLVAPWIDPSNDTDDLFKFDIDPNLVGRTVKTTIFNSDDDSATVQKSVQIIRKALPDIGYREFHNYGHFCLGDLKTEKFPELLDELL
jgi:predicted alpha/beta hydrolase family esterase